MNTEDSTIDLKDLLWRCCRRWKMLLVCMVVGAVVMNFYGVYQARHADDETEPSEEVTEEAPAEESEAPVILSAAEYRKKLTEQDASVVDETFAVYCAYRTQYQNYLNDYVSSAYMQIDPQNTAYCTLAYYIDDHYVAEIPTTEARGTRDAIIQQYAQWFASAETKGKIAKVLGEREDAPDLGYFMSVENSGGGVMTVRIVAADTKTRAQLVEVAEEQLDAAKENFRNAFGEFDVSQVQKNLYLGVNRGVQDTQNGIRSELMAARDRGNGLNGSFSEGQNAYYSALIRELDESNVQQGG